VNPEEEHLITKRALQTPSGCNALNLCYVASEKVKRQDFSRFFNSDLFARLIREDARIHVRAKSD
jgi:hypothetical protein